MQNEIAKPVSPEDTTLDAPGGTGATTQDAPWLVHYPEDIDWFQAFTAEPLFALLDRAADTHGEAVCTNFLGATTTYREIHERVDATALALTKLGVAKGDRVGLFLPNSPTFIIYYYAILKTGATVVNFNPLYTVEELAFQVRDSGTKLMITLDLVVLFEKVDALIEEGVLESAIVASFRSLLPSTKSVLFRLFKSRELALPAQSPRADRIKLDWEIVDRETKATFTPPAIDPHGDLAVIQYTGGTTGTPKGAMLTHANLSIQTQQVKAWGAHLDDGSERFFGALPFFHVFAMTVVMNSAIAHKSEMILMPRFVLDDALKLISKTKPTVMPGVPTLFNAMLEHPRLSSFDLSSLKFCISGGAALPLDVKTRFEKLTGAKLVEGYGLSETSPVATCNPAFGLIKGGSIGLPLPQTRISLRDLDDPTREVPRGEKGEICIAGPQVMRGYWNKPEETANAFVGEFFRTGDVAIMDEDGYFFIVDRIKDLIICSGYNVYPRRIEEAIQDFEPVAEVTVIGIADDYRGEAPKAFIKLREGYSATVDDVFSHLEPKLSKIEMPAEIVFRDELPKTMIGKLSRKELKAEEAERRQSQ